MPALDLAERGLSEAGDIGLVPWVPLTDFADPPETMMRRCREVIERHAPPGEKANLLAVTQVLAYLRYNSVELLKLLGGTKAMLEVPLIDVLVQEKYGDLLAEKTREDYAAAREAARETARETARKTAHQDIVAVLETRFGDVPRDLVDEIDAVFDVEQLKGLVRSAAACSDLGAFRDAIART
jgi:hypothetical protein